MRGRWIWVGFAAVGFVVLYVAIMRAIGLHIGDAWAYDRVIAAVKSGHPNDAYPVGGLRPSPPLFPLLALGPAELLGHRAAVYAVAAPIGALIVMWSAWSLGLRDRVRLVALAVVFALLPGTIEAVVNLGHQGDVLAAAMFVGAVALWSRQRWIWTGVVLGVALMTRQVVILGALPLWAACPRRELVRVAAWALGVCAVISLPFAVPHPRGYVEMLRANYIEPIGYQPTALLFRGHHDVMYAVGRGIPLAAGLMLAMWWLRRRPADPYRVLLLLAVPFLLRDLLDPLALLYYSVPAAALLLIAEVVYRGRFWIVFAWVLARWAVYLAADPIGPHWVWAVGVFVVDASALVLVAAAVRQPAEILSAPAEFHT